MLLILEFSINLILISFWLYSLLDRFFLCTSQGGKIDKYIKKYNLKNITSNFGKGSKKENIFIYFLSPNGSKYFINSIFATLAILAIKMAFTYKFLFSKFYLVNFFGKKVDLATIFSERFIIFKIIYYLSCYIIYLVLLLNFVHRKFSNKKNEESNKNIDKDSLIIGTESEVDVSINKRGLYQNILITGSIGSGKTSTIITTVFNYFAKNNIPGLVLDVKGNYIHTVKKIMKKLNSKLNLNIISVDERKL